MQDANEPRVEYPELKECAELSRRLVARVEADDPCDLHDLYEVTEGPNTENKLLLLRMYDKFLYPGIDQWVLGLLFDYLCLKGYPEPADAVHSEQVASVQSLMDVLDGHAEALSDDSKFSHLDLLFDDFSRADAVIGFLNDRGYLSPVVLRELLREATLVSPAVSSGVL